MLARMSTANALIAIADELSDRVEALSFAEPVAYVYNPLNYAGRSHRAYLSRFGEGPKEAVFLGMNPGPFGMAQTGVPFGEVSLVRDFLGICEPVGQPVETHPKRPVHGFDCPRSEVSGARFWGWVKTRFETPERFFERFFVLNYCPLVFMEAGGKNFIPEKLLMKERALLFDACDDALRKTVEVLGAKKVVGVGKFAEKRAKEVLPSHLQISTVLHPSPASPAANRGWEPQAEAQLSAAGIAL